MAAGAFGAAAAFSLLAQNSIATIVTVDRTLLTQLSLSGSADALAFLAESTAHLYRFLL